METKHIYTLHPSTFDGTEERFRHEDFAVKFPKTFDLRPKCPPVYDQGQEGSCTANAGCACRTMLAGDPTIYLSRAFLYYMERKLAGKTNEDCGASMKDIITVTQNNGICLDSDMPYVSGQFTTAPSDQAVKDALKFQIAGGKLVEGISGIKTALVSRQQPVLLGMTVYESMESEAVAKSGRLPMPKPDEQILGGHAVLIVGYQDNSKSFIPFFGSLCSGRSAGYWIVRNSWGAQWGDHGYFYMPYEYSGEYCDEKWIEEATA